jgi:hypothetical protein
MGRFVRRANADAGDVAEGPATEDEAMMTGDEGSIAGVLDGSRNISR